MAWSQRFVFLAVCFGSLSAFAQEEPVTVRGDQVEYFDLQRKVVATGKVVATYKEMKLTCDQATIYMETKDAYLKGRVRLFQPEGLLKGQEVIYNFNTRKGIVLQAEGEAGPWRAFGSQAQKTAGTSFLLRDGTITSCDFEQPHSRLKAKEVRVFLDDKVVLKHTVMYVGSFPVFYLPSYTHPLDDKRPRVTILPGKDKQWGLYLLTAWRLYLTENLQGRIHVDYRERLDLASGVDLKYALPMGGEGIFRSYYTKERAIQRDHLWSRHFNAKRHRQLTKERERFRFQLRHLWEIDKFTKMTLEYHRMKDPTMIQDFFLREFEKDTSPPSYFQIVRSAPGYGLTFLIDKRVNRFETATQQWPLIGLNIRPIRIPWLPTFGPRGVFSEGQRSPSGWYYESSSSYVHSNEAHNRNGTQDSLLRFNTVQELFHPMRFFKAVNFRPFGSFRHTADSRGAKELAPQFRQAAKLGFDLSTRFFRVFPLETDFLRLDIHRLRHIVTPNLTYAYQAKPTIHSDRFLRSDGLEKSNRMSTTVEHKFQTKRREGGGWQTIDLVRFSSGVSYDLEGAQGRGGRWDNLITLDLETKPYRWLYVESDATIDHFIGKFTSINADLIIPASVGARGARDVDLGIGEMVNTKTGKAEELPFALGLGWRYSRNTSSQLVLETEFNLGKKWRAGIYQGFDVKRFITETSDRGERTVKKVYDIPEFEYRLRRDFHEWTGELVFRTQRQQGEEILLLFRLKAFPDLPIEFERRYHQPKAGRNFPKSGEFRE